MSLFLCTCALKVWTTTNDITDGFQILEQLLKFAPIHSDCLFIYYSPGVLLACLHQIV